MRSHLTVALCAALISIAVDVRAAAIDDTVEWQGVSHVGSMDRRPLCPLGGESFELRFRAFSGDLTAARLHLDDGAVQWIPASVVATKGAYDIWSATAPASVAATYNYWLELSDGLDTDYYSVGGMSDGFPVDGGFIIDTVTLSHAPYGATPVVGGTVFRVWAPTRSTVNVAGEFNGWNTAAGPLTKQGAEFLGFVAGASTGQQYKFVFNGSHWNTDARARELLGGANYNARIVDPLAYSWGDGSWAMPPFEEVVLYQLHVGTFAGRNDPLGAAPFPSGYPEVEARVAHLVELGVNAIFLNPITEFPGDESAGYNPITQYAVEAIYGSPDELRSLVDICHQNGIAVLLDVVWNHFSASDNFLWFYDGTQIYFDTPAVETPWGSQADFDAAAVRDWFLASARMWFDEYGIDGFRMDGTDYMNQGEHGASGWSLMQELNDMVDNRYADKLIIAEQLPDDDWVTRPTSISGAGFDAQYFDAFTDRLREELLDAAFGDPEIWKIRDVVNGFGVWLSKGRVVNYLELHDEAWPSSGGQRFVRTVDTTAPHDDQFAQGRYKLGQGMVMLMPGIPAFLMGGEWLESTNFGTDLGSRIDWSKKTTYSGVFSYFQDLIALRTGEAAFRADASHSVSHLNESGNVIGVHRSDSVGGDFLVVGNFGNSDYLGYQIGLPVGGSWAEVINSESIAYGGGGSAVNVGGVVADGGSYDGFGQSATINVPARGFLVLEAGGVTAVGPQPVAGETVLSFAGAHPNPVSTRTEISFALERSAVVKLSVHDVRGRLVQTVFEGELAAGEYTKPWSAEPFASGVYLLRLVGAGEERVRKIVHVR